MLLAFLVLLAFLMLRIQALFYRKQCFKGVESMAAFQDTAVTEGEESSLLEVISNRKWLPLITLRVNFSISKALRFVEKENSVSTDYTYRNDIFTVMPYEKVTRILPFTCTRRGYYGIEDFYLLGHDLFMTEKFIKPFTFDSHLYVYPRNADTKRLFLPLSRTIGTILSQRYSTEDPFEFRGIRPYQIYDPMKTINWKASAKGDGLKVNVHNYTACHSVTLLLDLTTDEAAWQQDALLEESIRILCSYAEGLLTQAVPVRILSNGQDLINGQPFCLENGASIQHIRTIKEGLARVDIHRETKSLVPLLIEEQKSRRADTLYVLVSRIQSPALMKAYEALCEGRTGCQWIVPVRYDTEFPAASLKGAEVIRWEVPYGQL